MKKYLIITECPRQQRCHFSDCEITPENAAERKRMMEIRRANEKIEDDFSSIDIAIEVAGEELEDIDNSDFVHGLPVPPENNLGVSESAEIELVSTFACHDSWIP